MHFLFDNPESRAIFLIDRKNDYYFVDNLALNFPIPAQDMDKSFHTGTLLDGELVVDTQPDGSTVRRYLIFDCLALDGKPLMDRTLDKRLAYCQRDVVDPYKRMLAKQPGRREQQTFQVVMKKMEKGYATEMMFREVLPALQHGNDGLVFTCVTSPYTTGTDKHTIKWKPPHENTIDFRLQIGDFPSLGESNAGVDGPTEAQPDYDACPAMSLLVFQGNNTNKFFAPLTLTDKEWQAMKSVNQMLDDRIIECYLDDHKNWRPKTESDGSPRFRDDKTEANHQSTVDSVLQSIEDAVTEQDLRAQAKAIYDPWKEREKVREQQHKAEEAKRKAAEAEQKKRHAEAEELRKKQMREHAKAASPAAAADGREAATSDARAKSVSKDKDEVMQEPPDEQEKSSTSGNAE